MTKEERIEVGKIVAKEIPEPETCIMASLEEIRVGAIKIEKLLKDNDFEAASAAVSQMDKAHLTLRHALRTMARVAAERRAERA